MGQNCLLLLLLLLLVYSPIVNNGFVLYDDPVYVTENRFVHGGLTWQNVKWAFSTREGGNWHPLTWLSHQTDCTLFGLNPLGHHFTSLFFHWLNCSLLLWLLCRTTKNVLPSFLSVLCFALHPLAVDSVAWVSERKNLLCLFFWLLALCAHWKYSQTKVKPWSAASFTFMLLALMSKPMAVTLPFTLLLFDYWPLERKDGFFTLFKEKLHLFCLTLLFVLVTFHVQGGSGAITTRFPLSLRLANSVVTYVRYCAVVLWPTDLAVFYPFPCSWVTPIGVLSSAVFLVVFSFFLLKSYEANRSLFIGWCWFLGVLVPVIGLIQAGIAARTDRHTYIPLVGLFFGLIFWGYEQAQLNKTKRMLFYGLLVFCLVFWSALTWRQVHFWADSVTLFMRAAEVTRENYVTANNLGFAYMCRGDLEKAEKWLNIAVKLDHWYAPTLDNMGILKRKQGKANEAELWSRRAISRQPDKAGAHCNLALALLAQGRIEAAKKSFLTALALDDELANVHFQLGLLAAREGKMAVAISHFEKTVTIAPDFAQGHNNLGVLLAQKGDKTQAVSHFRRALALLPEYKEAQRNLLRALGKSQNP